MFLPRFPPDSGLFVNDVLNYKKFNYISVSLKK
jgi:hypothetical protein